MTHPDSRDLLLAALVLACSFAGPTAARADEPPALLLGPPPDDIVHPTGGPVAPARGRPEPAEAPDVACSFREAVCVHAPTATAPAATLWTLRYAERALRTFRALGLPPPLPDGALGGSPAYDLYLLPTAPGPSTTADLIVRAGEHDQASAFTVLPPPAAPTACATQTAVAHGLARAIGLRFDAGAEDVAAGMFASYLASLATGCELDDLAAVDDFQRAPERGLLGVSPDETSGALLFPWYLDDVWGLGNPARVIASLLAIGTQRTPPGAWTWHNEPDLFDALRANMKSRSGGLDDLLLDFAVARAFVGSRSDGAHLMGTEAFGDLGRVRVEWSLPFASLPRRVAPAVPLEPTGSTYLWVDLTGAPAGAELAIAADWEVPSIFRWSLVKVSRDGQDAGRLDLAGVYGDSHVERSLTALDGLAGVLVVGVNAGSFDRGHPFDPDEAPFMPHSYTVTLAK